MEYRTRDQWGATYDVSGRALMTGLPVAQVFVHHNVIEPTNDPNADMERTEQIDIGRFGVPSYSYAVHPSGVVLEGMGLHRGAHTIDNANNSFNNIAFGLMFMGDFRTDEPTDAAMRSAGELLAKVQTDGDLRPDFVLRGHRDVYATVCPGPNLYPRINELRGDDDLTPEQDQRLSYIADTVKGLIQAVANLQTDLEDPNTGLKVKVGQLAAASNPDALAAAIASKIPGVSKDQLEQAYRDVLKQGVG